MSLQRRSIAPSPSQPVDALARLAALAKAIDDGNPCFVGNLSDELFYEKDVIEIRDAVAELIDRDARRVRAISYAFEQLCRHPVSSLQVARARERLNEVLTGIESAAALARNSGAS